jgi:RNA recognition motif-containing protein
MGKDLYVKNISLTASEEELRKLFAVSGKVSHIHMVKDAKSGAFVGCAYVKMASEAEARDALVTLGGALLVDRVIAVSQARPQTAKPRPGSAARRTGRRPRT